MARRIMMSLSGFTNHLKQKFGTTDALNKAWGLNYWGEDVNGWENLPTRDNTISTGYKLEWSRWSQMRVTDFLVVAGGDRARVPAARPVCHHGLWRDRAARCG